MSDDEPSANLHPFQSFGLDVKQVRKARRMTQKGLGRATGYSEGHVSRFESGKVVPTEKFAVGADRVLGTGDLFARQLRRIMADLAGNHPNWFVPYVELEREASRIYDYSTTFIMGMLQTPEYARATLRAGVPRETADVVESRVVARIGRHAVMEREAPPRLWVVLHEACLRTVVGGREVMSQQLEHLAREAVSPSITLQVLPYSEGAPAYHLPFTLLGFVDAPTLLHAEGPQGGRPYDTAHTVSAAIDSYDHLRASALSPPKSIARIQEIAKEYANEQRRSNRLDQVELQRAGWRAVRRGGPRVRPVRRRARPGQQAQ
ncbi:helix-turn-helix transcriptional regulator [Streptomyces jumonjinensis]|uniref:Helix-turn-helix transcriptional regulator n=1 Tax=Streptomyces jumonjinensis TaxID=1945 RepID=A0A646KKJ0_STRJU|nr:helix-turn-helix transcriptional regulator [Streptomyces jumonjinensis]